jgi:chromatin remodeling complex protein RSC6
MTESKTPVNIKKMERSIHEMEILFIEQKQRLVLMEKEFFNFKKLAEKCIETTKKTVEKKPRKPSGFVLPVAISNELCDFLNIPHGSQVPRTEVTKYIIDYIGQEKLIHPEKKTLIVPDEKLKELLGDDVDLSTLTRFTIQKYMNRHYSQKDNLIL